MVLNNQNQKRDSYRVKLVRGPFVRLAPHTQSCDTEAAVLTLADQLRSSGNLIAADLFCGAGGLSLGLEDAGWRCILGIDHDKEAVETHRHHFGGLTADWDLADPEVVNRVGNLLKEARVDLVAGGPPCQPFSKAGRSMLRDLVRTGRRPKYDTRKDLWQGFLDVVALSQPRAVLMENVPEMALDRDMLVLRTMVDSLEEMGYGVTAKIVDTWRYEVPQHRQRLILIAMENGHQFAWPPDSASPVNLRQAIGDLPSVDGGWRPAGGADGWIAYGGPAGSFQQRARQGIPTPDEGKVFDHITRPVREDDAQAFAHMDPSTKYSDLPSELKRYRDDIFDDKYKRLDYDDLSRTITAHIAKDGYWYIHPEQDRTLSVREAARVQTFPDRFRFAGPPTAAFRQIGNAVPPNVGRILGSAIAQQLQSEQTSRVTTRSVTSILANWMQVRFERDQIAVPWAMSPTRALLRGEPITNEMRWLALLGEIIFDRSSSDRTMRDLIWPTFRTCAATPELTIDNETLIRQLAFGANREHRIGAAVEIARHLVLNEDLLDTYEGLVQVPGISNSIALTVTRLAPDGVADPVVINNPLVRLAARFEDSSADRTNVRTDGRMAIARLVGVDHEGSDTPLEANRAALAHLALVEISRTICRAERPSCETCPLEDNCLSAQRFKRAVPVLPFSIGSPQADD